MSKYWCEHTVKDGNDLWVFSPCNGKPNGPYSRYLLEDKKCPVCLKSRPEPKKGLAEKLYAVAVGGLGEWDDCYLKLTYKNLATCALEHFIGVIEENISSRDGFIGRLTLGEIKQVMRDSLNG